jgi:hypothetical protein
MNDILSFVYGVIKFVNTGCMPLCKLKKTRLLINAPPPNEKCPGNESKNYGMHGDNVTCTLSEYPAFYLSLKKLVPN